MCMFSSWTLEYIKSVITAETREPAVAGLLFCERTFKPVIFRFTEERFDSVQPQFSSVALSEQKHKCCCTLL